MRVRWMPVALRELSSMHEYIAKENPVNAARFTEELFSTVSDQMKAFPHSGRIIPEINKSQYREILFKGYRVMYKVMTDEVVLTVRNGRQLFNATKLAQ